MRHLKFTALLVILTLAALESFAQSPEDRYPFVRNGKLGFIDAQGREVIAPQFSAAGSLSYFNDGLAPVWGPQGGGYIDASGKFVIGPQKEWGSARRFYEGIAAVLVWGKNGSGNKPGWIDRTGKLVKVGDGAEGSYFSDGLMPMPSKSGKWGYVDKSFQFVIKPQFDWAEEFSEGRAVVKIKDRWGFIDKTGKLVVAAKYDLAWYFHDGLGRVRYDTPNGTAMTVEGEQTVYKYRYGFVDRDGNEVIAPQFEEATYFSEGFALARAQGTELMGIIDRQGRFVHAPEYEDASEFAEGLAAVQVDDKWGFVDTSGAWVIPAQFSYVENFWHGLARVAWKDGEYGYVNKKGEVVWKNIAVEQPQQNARASLLSSKLR